MKTRTGPSPFKRIRGLLCLILSFLILFPCGISVAEKPDVPLEIMLADELLSKLEMTSEELRVSKTAVVSMPSKVLEGNTIPLEITFPAGLSEDFKATHESLGITFGEVFGGTYGMSYDLRWGDADYWTDETTFRIDLKCGTPCTGNLYPGKFSCMVTVISKDSGYKGIFLKESRLVVKAVPVTSIKLNKTKATLRKGKTLRLKVRKFVPSKATNKKVKWSSSNKKVATVNKNGRVKARGKGTCYIICTALGGSGVTARCRITVK